MSHVAKSNAKGIGTSSFMDLKAELSKQESEVSRNKLAGIKVPIVRPDKVGSTISAFSSLILNKGPRNRLCGPARTRGSRPVQVAT